jgi:hypothetical protein
MSKRVNLRKTVGFWTKFKKMPNGREYIEFIPLDRDLNKRQECMSIESDLGRVEEWRKEVGLFYNKLGDGFIVYKKYIPAHLLEPLLRRHED